MALEKVIKLTQEQYNTLESGGTVGEYTGLDSNYLYMVENMGSIIDITNGITSNIKEYIEANPSTLFAYAYNSNERYIYVPNYSDLSGNNPLPYFYSSLAPDEQRMYYIVIDWNSLTIEDENSYDIITSHQSIKTLKTDNTTAQSTSSSESITGSGTINLHKIAKTGTYSDLIGKPTIPTSLDDVPDGSTRKLANYLPLAGGTMTGAIILNNQVAIKAKDTNGTAYDVLNSSSGNNLIINSGRLGDTLIPTNFRPTSSYGGAIDLGSSSYPWRALYATTVYENGTSLANKYIAKSLTTTKGDIIYASAANTPARLGIGTQGQVLKVGSSGVPVWSSDSNNNQKVKTSSVTFGADDTIQITEGSNITITGDATAKTITISGKAGTITSVATSGTGLSGGPITSTGTITLDSSSAGNAAANKVVLRNAAGSIQSEKFAVSSGTTTKVNIQYNTTEDCIEFVFA